MRKRFAVPRISYAQNAEDIVLLRVFGETSSGFYIDVGAADPRADSVTKVFYDMGWRGVNIEPQRAHFEDLERERPRDVNLRAGLGATAGRLLFARNRDIPGWSTFSPEFRERYEADDMALELDEVEVRTLADVCETYSPGVVDFLKVDVEGYELEVLTGGDWVHHRPRIVVIEATDPEKWENLLVDAHYDLALFDGLNRFYVRDEDADLVPALASPANVMDDYLCYVHVDRIAALEHRLAELEAELSRRTAKDTRAPASPIGWMKRHAPERAKQLVRQLTGRSSAV